LRFQLLMKGIVMDLAIWIPALLATGLAGLGLMFAFIAGCDKV